jgi:hypothetical protein
LLSAVRWVGVSCCCFGHLDIGCRMPHAC